jgi:hypothetical protein
MSASRKRKRFSPRWSCLPASGRRTRPMRWLSSSAGEASSVRARHLSRGPRRPCSSLEPHEARCDHPSQSTLGGNCAKTVVCQHARCGHAGALCGTGIRVPLLSREEACGGGLGRHCHSRRRERGDCVFRSQSQPRWAYPGRFRVRYGRSSRWHGRWRRGRLLA